MSRKRAKVSASAEGPTFVGFGEGMIRFMPLEPATANHLAQPFLRSIGGDELNVAVAMALTGCSARWLSVLPSGPMGDILADSCAHFGIEYRGPRVDGADVGVFHVLPERKTVHYQRRRSAFALHEPDSLDWDELLLSATRPWLHMTGITPLVSPAARVSWDRALDAAARAGVPTSLDFNHRKQLGTLEELWAIVGPHADKFEAIILSVEQLHGLAALLLPGATEPLAADADDGPFLSRMESLRALWRCKRVCVCRKVRDAAGVQKRWSLKVEAGAEPESTAATPVYHVPKDECGGGSAWAAGLIRALHFDREGGSASSRGRLLRRADLLSALCQETAGDFSAVTGAELRAAEAKYIDGGAECRLPGAEAGGAGAAFPPLPSAEAARGMVEATVAGLKGAGVLAILRAKGDPEVAIARGVELAAMGCRAMEVTLDSSDWAAVLSGLRKALPAEVMLGVGTVMDDTVCQLGRIKSLGGTFALSPIDPTGFVEECGRHGLLAIPSAFTSNECWDLHRRGVRMIKLFHAGLVSPSILKSMLDVTPLGRNLNIMPSGGVSPANAQSWWDAGAAVVGMGSNLVGKDVGIARAAPSFGAAVAEWEASGRQTARKLYEEVGVRFPAA